MATYTKNFGLKKPDEDDFYNIEDFNSNAYIIDEKLNLFEAGTEDLTPGVTPLENGKLYFVYE